MDLKRRLIAGSAWSTAATIGTQLANFVVIAIIARQIGATEFGTVAIVVVTLELSREIVTAGLPDYLIRHPSWDEALASSALIFQILVASLLAITMAGFGLLVSAVGSNVLGEVFVALAPVYVLDGAGSIFAARMYRDLRFRAITGCTVAASLAGGTVAIVGALSGVGLWALVLNRAVASIAGLVLIVGAARWRPAMHFSGSLWMTLRRSWRLAAANMLGAANLRVTDFVVGSVAGRATLGTYQIAGKALDVVLSTVVVPSQRVALTGFARIREQGQIAQGLLRVLALSSLVAFPVFGGISALSTEFVQIAFGPTWAGSAAPMTLLTLVGAPALITYLVGPVLTAVDRPQWLIQFAILMTAASAISAACTAAFGVRAIAAGFLVRSLFGGALALLVLRRAIALPASAVLRTLAPAATSAAVMYLVVGLLRQLVEGLALYSRTGVLVLAGATTYVLVLGLVWRRPTLIALRELRS